MEKKQDNFEPQSGNFQIPKIKILGVGGGGCNFHENMTAVLGSKLS